MRSITRQHAWHQYIASSILSFFVSTYSFGKSPEAVVIKTQTPLYLEQGNEESIVEYRIQGDLLVIYDNHLLPANLAEIYTHQNQHHYYQTFDRNGRLVFVTAKDVEVYYNDDREVENTKTMWEPKE